MALRFHRIRKALVMTRIQLDRHSIAPGILDIPCSLGIPSRYVAIELPDQPYDFVTASESAPLAVFGRQPEGTLVAVAVRPAYETGSVLQWMNYLTEHFGLSIESMKPQSIGARNEHLAIVAIATQTDERERVSHRLIIAGLEDGGRFLTVHAKAPIALWEELADELIASVTSLSLTAPRGATHDLDSLTAPGWRKISYEEHRRESERAAQERAAARAPALRQAEVELKQGNFEGAEHAILAADQSIEGAVALARLYEAELRRRVSAAPSPSRDELAALYHRALRWALSTYPDPHTREEADSYEEGRDRDRANLIEILGWEPAGS